MKVLVHALGLLVLAFAEIAVYLALKKAGASTPAAVGVALVLCLTVFFFVGMRMLSAGAARAPHYSQQRRNSQSSAQSPSARMIVRRAEGDTDADFRVPTSMSSTAHTRSEAYLTELQNSLIEKKMEFSNLLAETGSELGRFDYGVLKTLEKNQPGSVEGVVTARKIHHALERRVKEMEHFLSSQSIVDPEKGKMLLLGDLEVKEENQLTSVFKTPPVPPIKISEVEFQLRVLMKRISRRRSIFRPNEIPRELGTDEPVDQENPDEDSETNI